MELLKHLSFRTMIYMSFNHQVLLTACMFEETMMSFDIDLWPRRQPVLSVSVMLTGRICSDPETNFVLISYSVIFACQFEWTWPVPGECYWKNTFNTFCSVRMSIGKKYACLKRFLCLLFSEEQSRDAGFHSSAPWTRRHAQCRGERQVNNT